MANGFSVRHFTFPSHFGDDNHGDAINYVFAVDVRILFARSCGTERQRHAHQAACAAAAVISNCGQSLLMNGWRLRCLNSNANIIIFVSSARIFLRRNVYAETCFSSRSLAILEFNESHANASGLSLLRLGRGPDSVQQSSSQPPAQINTWINGRARRTSTSPPTPSTA